MKNKKQIIEEINRLRTELFSLDAESVRENTKTLINEILDLESGVGRFTPGDYYAPDRLESRIPGVKNLRAYQREGYLLVRPKLVDNRGFLMPTELTIEGLGNIKVEFLYSKNFTNEFLE
jgi:hypothetical protein